MSFDFPNTPIEGEEYTPAGGATYVWHAPRWMLKAGTSSGGGGDTTGHAMLADENQFTGLINWFDQNGVGFTGGTGGVWWSSDTVPANFANKGGIYHNGDDLYFNAFAGPFGGPAGGFVFNIDEANDGKFQIFGGDLRLESAGTKLFVPDQAYGPTWDGDLSVPTKNAVYDKIQTLSGGGGAGPTTKAAFDATLTDGNFVYQDSPASVTHLDTFGHANIFADADSVNITSVTGSIEIGSYLTSGILSIGGYDSTGGMSFGNSFLSQQISIGGMTGSGESNNITIGTGGQSGSTTNVTIGGSNGTTVTLNGSVSLPQTTNLKTINGTSLIGSGNIVISGGGGALPSATMAEFDTACNNGDFLYKFTSISVNGISASGTLSLSANAGQTIDMSGTTGNMSIGGSLTSGLLTIGGSNTSGAFTFDRSTNDRTINISSGATASGKTKTINFGIGGLAGSITNINIGSAAGTSTTTISGTLSLPTTTNLKTVNGTSLIGTGNIVVSGGSSPTTKATFNTALTDGDFVFVDDNRNTALTGTLAVANGGTGLNGSDYGALLVSSDNLQMEFISPSDGGKVLTSTGFGGFPYWAYANSQIQTPPPSSVITINPFNTDQMHITGLSVNTTIDISTTNAWSGQKIIIRIRDNGTARTIAWNALFRAIGVTLPLTTVPNKLIYVTVIYNGSDLKWDVIAVAQET